MDIKSDPLIQRLKERLRVTKVVCTRSVKGRSGDHYVGFSAAWDSTQDDAGGAADLMTPQGEGDMAIAQTQIGMTLKEAKVAAFVLGMQADIAAHDHSAAGGSISEEQRDQALRAIKTNYSRLIVDMLGDGGGQND